MAASASHESAPTPRGDEESLYRAHHTRLLHLIDRDVGARPQVVEDACAFAWAELLARQPERTSIVGWLRVVARREAIRLARCDRVTVLMSAIDPDGLPDHGRSTSCPTGRRWRARRGARSACVARRATRAQAQLLGRQGRRVQLRRDRRGARRQLADGQPPARPCPSGDPRGADGALIASHCAAQSGLLDTANGPDVRAFRIRAAPITAHWPLGHGPPGTESGPRPGRTVLREARPWLLRGRPGSCTSVPFRAAPSSSSLDALAAPNTPAARVAAAAPTARRGARPRARPALLPGRGPGRQRDRVRRPA